MIRNSTGGGSHGFDLWVPTSVPMGCRHPLCGYPVPISMADMDPTLEMTGIRDSPFTPSPSPLLRFRYHAFDYLLTCPTLHLRSAACSLCLWNPCCECGVSTTACTIPAPMLAPTQIRRPTLWTHEGPAHVCL